MKIAKLIIPFLGLSQINNANKQELLQIEKLPEISYEVSMKDNWDNYYYLTSDNFAKMQDKATQLNVKNSDDLAEPVDGVGCWIIYLGAVSLCQAMYIDRAAYGYCMRQAWRAYMACEHG